MPTSTADHSGTRTPDARGAFGGFIGPRNLIELVRNSAPWLFDGTHRQALAVPEPKAARLALMGATPLGWWTILRAGHALPAADEPTPAQRTDYFALCLAAHFASVATYVPTDVDAKIRHALWLAQEDRDELNLMRDLAFQLAQWDVSGVSARIVHVQDHGSISGHDGERLSVLCGGLLAFANAGDETNARLFEDAIDAELAREAALFDHVARSGAREQTLVVLAAILTHNAGDVMQALGSKGGQGLANEAKQRFADLARERFERYGGAFGRAAALYRELAAAEGHRNYPLREVKHLRAHPDLLLPAAPFLDDWGATLARFPGWKTSERAAVVAALVGCRRVSGQQGYYRALAGFERASPNGLEARELAEHWTNSVRKELKSTEMRKLIGVKRESFESSYRKRVRQILGS